MTVTILETRPSTESENGVYDDSDGSRASVATSRQQTPDLVPLRDHSSGIMSASGSVSTDGLNSKSLPSDNNNVRSDSGDVSAVVDKAKKAALSLWILIHAQNCRLGGDRCQHKGCVEAKRVLLHLKTCPAANNGHRCPSDFNGCHQSRKLLAHHQKCREIRAKQAGMGRRANTVHHVCLVCSLVARQAKNVLEASTRKTSSKKQVIASFTLSEPGPDVIGRRNSSVAMPPPPPRQPSNNLPMPSSRNHCVSDSSSDDGFPCDDSPPSSNQLLMFSEVVAAAASSPPTYTSVLGKSVDSGKHQFLTFAASALQNLKRAIPTEDLSGEQITSPRRSRAESYDERALTQYQKPMHDYCITSKQSHVHADPTWELDLKGEQSIDLEPSMVTVKRRLRSASLGMLASACLSRDRCDTIEEEESTREGGAFEQEEDLPFQMDECD